MPGWFSSTHTPPTLATWNHDDALFFHKIVCCCCCCCCRIQFSPDGTCLWALATLPQPDGGSSTDAPPTTQRADNSSSSGSSEAGMSCLLCFSVADGSLLQQLQQPHGTSAVRHFCLDGAGAVMATCGTDQLLKLWSVGVCAGVPVCQSFTAHHGALSGRSVVGGRVAGLQGWGSVLLRDFKGTSAVRYFWLYAAVMAMCGTD